MNLDDCWIELEGMITKDLCDYEDLRYSPEEYAQIQKDWNEYEDNRRRKGFTTLQYECCPWAHEERRKIEESRGERMTDPTDTLPIPYQSGSLKSCPFCGSDAMIAKGCGEDWVQCMNPTCGCCSSMHTNTGVAIEIWNRRVKE